MLMVDLPKTLTTSLLPSTLVEAKQILDDATNFIWRQKPDRDFTAQQAKDQSIISQCLRKDKAYRFMKNVRGSPPYYQKTFYELLATWYDNLELPLIFSHCLPLT